MSDQFMPIYQIGSPEAESKEGKTLTDEDLRVIINDYVRSVQISTGNPAHQFFLCPVGLVGAGKSTVLKPLSERFGLVRISTDEIRKLLSDRGFNHIRTVEIAFKVIQKFALEGRSLALDSDCAGVGVTKTISELAQKFGAKVIWIHVNPPEEFILNKLKNFKHTWLFKDADDALASYYRRKPLHKNIDLPFTYTFDTSKNNFPEQMSEAIRKIESEINKE